MHETCRHTAIHAPYHRRTPRWGGGHPFALSSLTPSAPVGPSGLGCVLGAPMDPDAPTLAPPPPTPTPRHHDCLHRPLARHQAGMPLTRTLPAPSTSPHPAARPVTPLNIALQLVVAAVARRWRQLASSSGGLHPGAATPPACPSAGSACAPPPPPPPPSCRRVTIRCASCDETALHTAHAPLALRKRKPAGRPAASL